MKTSSYVWIALLALVGASSLLHAADRPNIVIIYADDMGYGDLNIQNPGSKIPTPHLDQLAREGMRFTDAHSSSGICSPSRFALLTGTYHWRRQHGIVQSFGPPAFFRDDDYTLPQMLKDAGYHTAAIGKWHLGFDWTFKNPPSGRVEQWNRVREYYKYEDVDWSQPITGGPLDRGFDYYFGDGTINFPPYAWMENERMLDLPTSEVDINNMPYDTLEGNWEFRPGPMVEGWNPYDVLPTLTKKAVEWVHQQEADQPFFLYFPLPSPHAPIIPNKEFLGKSAAGAYGDFVYQSDWVAGQVLQALEDKGLADNTLVIFTADNGPEAYAWERARRYDHFSMGELRGLKRDVWEGGHHVPFIIKWPGRVPAHSVSNEVISQVDIMATIAAVTNTSVPTKAAPDSYNFLPVAEGASLPTPLREATVHNTYDRNWGLRQDKWLYIDGPTGGSRNMPDFFMEMRGYEEFTSEALLFDLEADLGQRNDLSDQHPQRVADMAALLERYQKQGHSVRR
ncbi:arylsulfatase [Opitutaceae bacterium]|nr:arylsulfatase [Opitutaceae bacterium]MDB4474120.1 arylsulfatase [Opitutaceae bacterium]